MLEQAVARLDDVFEALPRIQHLNGAQDAEIENSQPEKSKLDKSKDRGDAVARRPGRSLSA